MIKRLASVLLILALLLAAAAPALADNTMQQGSMYVNTANGKALRFRSSRSTSEDNILTEIPYGTKVYVLSWNGTWARVQYNSAVGYVVQKHLSIARPEPYSVVEASRAAAAVVKEQKAQRRAENAKLDHSRIKSVLEYDVTVRVGVEGMTVRAYPKADLTSTFAAEYADGARLTVQAQNKSWAKVYDGAADKTYYMLLEDLEPDLVEEEVLEDDDSVLPIAAPEDADGETAGPADGDAGTEDADAGDADALPEGFFDDLYADEDEDSL